jgi:pimeloyl-ACP methyl ester carboxylesterase
MKILFLGGFGIPDSFYRETASGPMEMTIIENPSFTYGEAAEKLSGQIKTGGAMIAAWSLGSLFALRYAIENPETVNGLFLTGATARFCEKPGYSNTIPEKTLLRLIRLLPGNPLKIMSRFYSSILDEVPGKDGLMARLLKDLPPAGTLIQGLEELHGTDLLDRLPEIKTPVMIAQGERDRTTPLEGARYMQERIRGARIMTYEGGHSLFFEQPGLFFSMLREFSCTTGK